MDATPLLWPAWPALPANVRAASTLRHGAGRSGAPWAHFNLGDHVGDCAATVAENRRQLADLLALGPSCSPVWLSQVHGSAVVDLGGMSAPASPPVADASTTTGRAHACALLTADCLPVLLSELSGAVVGAAHAGWRGLAGGVVEATVAAMGVPADRITAWLGPCIGPTAFEVGPEVRASFVGQDTGAAHAFAPGAGDRWFADLRALARQRLLAIGLAPDLVYGTDACTFHHPERFFSYRRDGVCGRMASLIWRANGPTR